MQRRTTHSSPSGGTFLSRSPALTALAFLVLGSLLGLPASVAQEEAVDDPMDAFSDVVNVNVVNLEVYVTDKKGNPISGLVPDDFEVFEDGKPMRITNFYAVEDGVKVAELTADGTVEKPLPEPSVTFNRIETPEREKLKLVVFIDNFNINANHRRRIMGQLRQFINSATRRGDQVMLISYDRKLNIRRGFTSDSFLIGEALRELDEVRGEAGQYDSMRKRILKDIDESRSSTRSLNVIRPYADTLMFDIDRTLDALHRLVDYLAGLPGRKAVLHVSSGIHMIAGGDLFNALTANANFEMQTIQTELAMYDNTRGFEQLTNHANANDVTFYTLDAAGLRTRNAGSAEHEGLDSDRMGQALDSAFEANLQAPLYMMAEETGGQAILNRNEILPALEEVARDFRHYYSLGYQPAHYGTGRYYNIKVKVKVKDRKGLRLRHRDGYRDKNNVTAMTEGTMAALRHSFAQNPLGVEIGIGEGHLRKQDQFMVPIQVRIPMRDIVLLPHEDGWHARVRLYIAVMDDQGDTSEVQDTPLGIKIPKDFVEKARGEKWLYNHQLLVRRGRQKLAIGVRDELGAQEAFITRAFDVGG